ncbi:MAG: GNAT family N-acetyltransferase [Candidatus Limnocylindria bacterium]
MTTISAGTVRPFRSTDEDYAALAAASGRIYTDYPWSPEEMRHEDASWDSARFFKERWLLEADAGVVGFAILNHSRHSFVADTYWLDLGVVPDARRRGHGTALYERVHETLRSRGARRIRAGAKESMADGVEFLLRRGFVEDRRDWESRLPLRELDLSPFSGARERVEAAGIRISTLADEMAGAAEAARKAYDLAEDVHLDVPSSDPVTPVDYETWAKAHLEGPNFMPEAWFLAIGADGRWLAMSNMEPSDEDKTFLWQGLTGVRREARGKGLAMALKLETVRFARARGVDHIKTWNDQRNRPMLRINEALGFVKQPAWIHLHKDLEAS